MIYHAARDLWTLVSNVARPLSAHLRDLTITFLLKELYIGIEYIYNTAMNSIRIQTQVIPIRRFDQFR